ncbi:TPR-like protein [Polychaeton citri CBS 116435]|uniref:TPR-like protein n=1 Tax=Polychaeton citri CBS 116435 TaxID=1314669 RepID=A0A9P4Q5U1_9PEZI|nr:TPR-like protein [Polychaeton citri CBS 116435]
MVLTSTTALSAQHLRNQIYYHLDIENTRTASFLAGRLHALDPRTPDSSHLLALTALRLRRFGAAYDVSIKYAHNGRHLGCAFIFAQSCLELGRYTEGITALEKAKTQWQGKSSWNAYAEGRRRFAPDAPAVWNVLGKLWQRHGDSKKAGECFVAAHKANFFVWESFEGLCNIGADLEVDKMFRPSSEMLSGIGPGATASRQELASESGPVSRSFTDTTRLDNGGGVAMTPGNDPFAGNGNAHDGASFMLPKVKGKTALSNGIKSSILEVDTPTANGRDHEEDIDMGEHGGLGHSEVSEAPAAPPRRPRLGTKINSGDRIRQPMLRNHPQVGSESGNEHDALSLVQRKPSVGGQKRTITGHPPQASNPQGHQDVANQPTRRSNRLFTQTTATTTRSTRQANGATTSALVSEDRTVRPARTATGTRGRVGAQVGRVVSGNTRKIAHPDQIEKDKIRRAPSRNGDKAIDAPSVASLVLDPKPQRSSQPSEAELEAQRQHVLQQRQSLDDLSSSLGILAQGAYALSQYDLPSSLQAFKSLPTAQRETPHVLAQMGKACYESANYQESEAYFAKLLRLQPSRIEDMEVYSTVLWQLKKDSALALLCHTLRESHFGAPQTWVAVGNAFSLSREHDQAIAAFKRATQVAGPDGFAYAWTLMGHELIANEEFDAGLSAFRKAVSVDQRGFGGWYGLGECYKRMGKYEEAERHYRIAASLNPSNAVLLVCIGVVLERLQKREPALAHYCRALDMAPQSALARFKRARILLHMRHFEDALEDLEALRSQAPDEANVWFLLGKCFKGLGQRGDALRAFTTALNLDVKAAPFIKEAIETLDLEDDDSDDE